MVKSFASFHHFILVFVVSTERNYGKISWFSSSKLRLFTFFSPRKFVKLGNNNPKIKKFGLLVAIPARIQNNVLVMQDS